jgi:hypothetical protein
MKHLAIIFRYGLFRIEGSQLIAEDKKGYNPHKEESTT